MARSVPLLNNASLTEHWTNCIRILERYADFSSIARRSCLLLQRSARRLIRSQTGSGLVPGGSLLQSSYAVPETDKSHNVETTGRHAIAEAVEAPMDAANGLDKD